MAKIDLRDAYFSIPISEHSKKYLRFTFKDKLYQFNCLPFGLCTAPMIFTKIMKPIVTYLREKENIIMTHYLDDSLYINDSKNACIQNIKSACKLFQNLGFVINYQKSIFEPSQSCDYLGFTLDSRDLTVSVPTEKQVSILTKLHSFKLKNVCKIREFSQLLGSLTAICPAVPYGWVYTKLIEREKYLALQDSNENYDDKMSLIKNIYPELQWWIDNIHKKNPIKQHTFELEIHTDASRTGWGAVCEGKKASGSWSSTELKFHINYLELKAAFLGLQCFAKDFQNCEILLRVDNTTAVAYINKMGGVQFKHLNSITRELWQWCEKRNIWVFASYINSKDNFEADTESRKINIEWELSQSCFEKIRRTLGEPEIDLFASRINNKCQRFVSWMRDPAALAIDAFTLDWKTFFFYAFPPFSLILKCVNKIITDRAVGILVFPYWPSQPWFPLIEPLLVKDLLIFSPNKSLLTSPYREPHPMHQHLTLAAGLLSAKHL
ncbi:hypothetical protein PYW07_010959 [Mythimna separata]|uniref:Reverse transcriptase domain-containing protein n=1 Tax=Mythimna separata TaxID=271217 RepID=A0AAD7Y8F4_MYTSE|nr:hypothetical protein PYW07_010959 [Mythimna separata]